MFGAYLGELRGRAARIRREQENETKRAIAEEQARIARELHDVMAHSRERDGRAGRRGRGRLRRVAGAGTEALRSIESTGRQALAEVRRVLDVVRPDEEMAPSLHRSRRCPAGGAPGEFRAAGLPVTLADRGRAVEPAATASTCPPTGSSRRR